MASAIFILDLKGKPLIARDYRGDIPLTAIERFMPLLQEREDEEGTGLPVMTENGVTYLHLREKDVY
ncbi:AP-1 adaptor complex mu subunit Apm1, partial [Coemansia sp. RSA 1933]